MKPTDHIANLGLPATDKVTGFSGIITSVSFDLYGCIQYVVSPPAKDGKRVDSIWCDVCRLAIDDSASPVIEVPDFTMVPVSTGHKGPAEKPLR